MEFKFYCQHCGQHIAATDDQVGTRGVCPTCSRAFDVPAPDGYQPEHKAQPPPPPRGTVEPQDPPTSTAPPPPQQRQQGRNVLHTKITGRHVAIALLMLLVVGSLGAIAKYKIESNREFNESIRAAATPTELPLGQPQVLRPVDEKLKAMQEIDKATVREEADAVKAKDDAKTPEEKQKAEEHYIDVENRGAWISGYIDGLRSGESAHLMIKGDGQSHVQPTAAPYDEQKAVVATSEYANQLAKYAEKYVAGYNAGYVAGWQLTY